RGLHGDLGNLLRLQPVPELPQPVVEGGELPDLLLALLAFAGTAHTRRHGLLVHVQPRATLYHHFHGASFLQPATTPNRRSRTAGVRSEEHTSELQSRGH